MAPSTASHFRRRPRYARRHLVRGAISIVLSALCLSACTPRHLPAPSGGPTPRREDRGELIVLHLYGSYYDMGRQQVELLGPVARRMYEHHRDKYRRQVAAGGFQLKLLDIGMTILPTFGGWYEESGFFEEVHGMADALGVSRADALRAVVASSFGSTVFVATRGATADGKPIIGRNVDWDDAGGTMRPVLMHFHPSNGDLAYIMAGWPLIAAPAVGINEAGFALSFNFFITDEFLGTPPQMRDRRALQTARTVEEGLRVFTTGAGALAGGKRAMPTFMVMADASGDIAMIECTPSEHAVFRPAPPDADWFAHANHARTEKMIPFDRFRHPDSFQRQAAMEAAVRPHLGRITPGVAARILRDRSNGTYVNDPTVANLGVLNAAVIQPHTKTIWHSTTMQPFAPFGEFVAFSPSDEPANAPSLPADPRLGTPDFDRQAAVIAEARWAVGAFAAGDHKGAAAVWDRIAGRDEPLLDPARVAYGRALARARHGRIDEAADVLRSIDAGRAPFDVGAAAAVLAAAIEDSRGRRAQALELYSHARSHLDTHPEYSDLHTQRLRSLVAAGAEEPRAGTPLPDLPDLQRVPW